MASGEPPEYGVLSDTAAMAFHMGQHRLAATKYIESFNATPTKWSRYRFHIFHGFVSILTEKHFDPDPTDFEFLERVMKDKLEPKLYRCQAAFSLGLLRWDKRQREEAAECYRDAIGMGEKAPAKERRKLIKTNSEDDTKIVERSVGDVIDGILEQARDNLLRLESERVHHTPLPCQMRSDGTPMPETRRRRTVAYGPLPTDLNPDQMGHLLAVGGLKCDHCGKTRDELGVAHLQSCSRCKKAYYCSADCQRKQWREGGHKQHCRLPGQIMPGDYVLLNGLQARPELNGIVVQAVRAVPEQPGRWETRIPGGERSVSIAQEKMEQLRPLK